jgi:hypothetical protein
MTWLFVRSTRTALTPVTTDKISLIVVAQLLHVMPATWYFVVSIGLPDI